MKVSEAGLHVRLMNLIQELSREPANRPKFKGTKDYFDYLERELNRVAKATEILTEIETYPEISGEMSGEVSAAFTLGLLIGGALGGLCAHGQTSQIVMAQVRRLQHIEKINQGREVGAEEHKNVRELNARLMTEFPKPAPRYREIAHRLSTPKQPFKDSRVRYILEGPRKKNRKA